MSKGSSGQHGDLGMSKGSSGQHGGLCVSGHQRRIPGCSRDPPGSMGACV